LLAPEDLLLHLCLHESYHHRFDWSALRGLLDIRTVLERHPEVDWQVLAERANAWGGGAAGFVYATFRLARELLGAPVPDRALELLAHEPADDAIVELAQQNILSPELVLPEPYLEVADQSGIRRWRFIWNKVFLPRESLERMYGVHSASPIPVTSYFRRIVDLLGRRGKLLLQSLFRTRRVRSALRREANRKRIEGWVSRRAQGGAAPDRS
jgi:hypothetical protein